MLVLAGGRGSPFGLDKLAATWDGHSLLDNVVSVASRVSDDVILLTPYEGPRLRRWGIRQVPDLEQSPGPLVALRGGLGAARHRLVVLVGGDRPAVSADVLRMLADRVGRGSPIAALCLSGKPERLPLALRRDGVYPFVHHQVQRGERRLATLLDAGNPALIGESEWRPVEPYTASRNDVDTIEDLGALAI